MPTDLPAPVVPADQAVRHLHQVGHDRQADDVLAETDGELRAAVGVGLRAEHLRQADRLPLRVGQLERHRRLAGNGLDDADRHQAQRARQILREVDDLRSLHTDRGLDLVARDHGPRRRGDHAHLDAEVLELLLDQPRGHLERLGAHRLLPLRCRIEQVDLRQLGVDELVEERLLPFLDDARAQGLLDQRRLDDDRQVLLVQLVLDLDDLLALTDGFFAQPHVFLALDARAAAQAQRIDPRTDALGGAQPREAEPERDAGDQHRDPEHARSGEAQQRLARLAERVAEHATGIATGDRGLVLVEPRPLERAAGGEQQGEAEPDGPARRRRSGVDRVAVVRAEHAGEAAQPDAPGDEHGPPGRIASEEERHVGEPGTDGTGLVLDRAAGTRRGEPGVGSVVGDEGQHGQNPGDGADEQGELGAPRWRDPRHRWRCGSGARGAFRAVDAEGSEWKRHPLIVLDPRPGLRDVWKQQPRPVAGSRLSRPAVP